jgi:hypothetical protein
MKRREFIGLTGGLGASAIVPLSSTGDQHLSAGLALPSGGAEPSTNSTPTPIAIHPENPKYFLFRGKPLVLIAATEHYGSVVNRRFDFTRYLAEAADKMQTVSRLFLFYRELQSVRNPYSPLKAESPDFVMPFARTGPGSAMDGELKYDLDRWNPEYFNRLHRFLSMASDLGIVVETTVFSNTYADEIWALNPLRDKNNLQGIGTVEWHEYNSLRNKALVDWQLKYLRKVVQETSKYDNVYYEVCNEPGGGLPGKTTTAEVDAWQQKIADTIREELRSLNRTHLLFGQNAFSYAGDFSQDFDAGFTGSMLDVVNVHPLPNLILRGRKYQLGNFMSKELQLADFRDFFLAAHRERKPSISDEDNTASMYCDEVGWTIQRKRAWMAVLCGSHYDYIDFSIQVGLEAGTKDSRRQIRSWMRNLSEFIHSYDFIHAQPAPDWIEAKPAPCVAAALAIPGADYVGYLADGREVTDPAAGKPLSGPLSFRLPAGDYRVSLYSPATGAYSPCLQIQGGQLVSLTLAPFEQDIVVRATRVP